MDNLLMLRLIEYSGLGCVGLGTFILVYSIARVPPSIPPQLGSRGLKRQRAIAEGGSFASADGLIRFVASYISRLPLNKTRRRIDEQLVISGDWLGLTADELLSMSVLGGLSGFSFGLAMTYLTQIGIWLPLVFGFMGFYLPIGRLKQEIGIRFKQVNRSLPTAIDLAALCMGAGLDFPGALRQITSKSGRRDALIEELERIIQELELGRSRKQALESFAERCPTESVRDFVGAVVQAEEKGNPLAEVLRIQAGMLRLRRSIAAEESAARAAVMMMIPLMFIFCAIIMVLLGPFIVNSSAAGF